MPTTVEKPVADVMMRARVIRIALQSCFEHDQLFQTARKTVIGRCGRSFTKHCLGVRGIAEQGKSVPERVENHWNGTIARGEIGSLEKAFRFDIKPRAKQVERHIEAGLIV